MDAYSLKLAFLQITFEALSYGVFAVVGTITVFHIARRGLRKSLGRQTLMAITMIMVLGATVHLGLHLASIVLGLTPDVVPRSTFQILNIVQVSIRRLIYFLSDVVVVWRAWAIWSKSLMIRIVLSICLFATFATSLTLYAFNILSIEQGRHYQDITQNFLGTFCLLLTNFVATGLIGYKLWYYRRNLKQYINRGNQRTKVESILILLLESGGLYCVFWILLMVGDFGYFDDFGLEWVQPNVSGIYLTVVVLVVSQRKMLSPEVLAYTSQSVRLESLTGSGTVPAAWSAPTPPRRKEGKSFSYPDRVHVVQTREYYSSSPRDSYL
ncbi:hypothetical protein B0H14DRAFT_2642823 [Mycena olivaceomarginata]|nr:hypothetical protein B0H14DRAFT_2642823 [Mycena olivaceomarginata]